MEPLFQCPPPTALATIPSQSCPFRLGQIVRMFLMRRQSAALFDETDVKVVATWTPLLAETDDTKVIGSPLLSNVIIPPTEILQQGGNDNTTIDGIPEPVGIGFAQCTAQLKNAEPAVVSALRALVSESALMPGVTDLEAIFVNSEKKLIYRKSSTDVFGIPVYNFLAGDHGTEGFNASTINSVQWALAGGWSKNIAMIDVTDFDPMFL